MSRREDLRPWARRVPGFVLRLLLVVALPIFIVVGAWEDGIKESLEAWLAQLAAERECADDLRGRIEALMVEAYDAACLVAAMLENGPERWRKEAEALVKRHGAASLATPPSGTR